VLVRKKLQDMMMISHHWLFVLKENLLPLGNSVKIQKFSFGTQKPKKLSQISTKAETQDKLKQLNFPKTENSFIP